VMTMPPMMLFPATSKRGRLFAGDSSLILSCHLISKRQINFNTLKANARRCYC
jgi:hypothetical protein